MFTEIGENPEDAAPDAVKVMLAVPFAVGVKIKLQVPVVVLSVPVEGEKDPATPVTEGVMVTLPVVVLPGG